MEKNKKINIDTTIEDVLSLNKEGYTLIFDSEPGKFLELEGDVVDKLSHHNKTSYWASFGLNRKENEQKFNPKTEGINIRPRFATASGRLDVKNKKPGLHYAWKRTDELHTSLARGYKIETDPNLDTFQRSAGSRHIVGVAGNEEMILMTTPQELFDERIKETERKSKFQDGAVTEAAISNLERQGGKPFVPNSKDNNKWS